MPVVDTHPSGMPAWIDVMVPTWEQREKLMSFYSAIFGWTWEVGTPDTGFYSTAHHSGRAVMGIGQSPLGEGTMVTYFATDDIAASARRAAELGGDVFVAPTPVMDLGSMALVLDPTGAVHGLWEPKSFQGFAIANEPGAPGWFDHTSKDPDRAMAYYRDLTGHQVMQSSPEMRILHAGEQWFASISYDQIEDRGTAQWNVVFVVDSLSRFRDEVSVEGGVVVLEEMAVPGSAISVFVEPVMKTTVTVMQAGQAPPD